MKTTSAAAVSPRDVYRNFGARNIFGFPIKHTTAMIFQMISRMNVSGLLANAPLKSSRARDKNISVTPQPPHKKPVMLLNMQGIEISVRVMNK